MPSRKRYKFSDFVFGNSPLEYLRTPSIAELKEILGDGEPESKWLTHFGDLWCGHAEEGDVNSGGFYLACKGERLKFGKIDVVCDEVYQGMTEWALVKFLRTINVPFLCFVSNQVGDPEALYVINRRLAIRFWQWDSPRYRAQACSLFFDNVKLMQGLFRRDLPEFNIKSSLRMDITPL